MTRRFRGKSVHKVDQKGRVSVPATFRRALEEGDPDWHDGLNPNLVIVYGRPGKKFLECYSIKAMAELDEMIEDLPPFSEERDELERFLATKSVYAEVDPTGRIVLSQKLREQIGIADEAVFAGTINTFKIWAPADYEAQGERIDREAAERPPELDPFRLLKRRRQEGGS